MKISPTSRTLTSSSRRTPLGPCVLATLLGAAALHAQTAPAPADPTPRTSVDLGAFVGVSNILAYVANPSCINTDCFKRADDPKHPVPARPVGTADLRLTVDDRRLPVQLFTEIWAAADSRDISHAQEFGLRPGLTETDVLVGAAMRPRKLGPGLLWASGDEKSYHYSSGLLCSRPGCPPDQLVEADVSYGGHLQAGMNFQLKTNDLWKGGYSLIPRLTASGSLMKDRASRLDVDTNFQATHDQGFFGRQGWTGVRGGIGVSRPLGNKARLKLSYERYLAFGKAPLYTGNVFQVTLSSGLHWQRR